MSRSENSTIQQTLLHKNEIATNRLMAVVLACSGGCMLLLCLCTSVIPGFTLGSEYMTIVMLVVGLVLLISSKVAHFVKPDRPWLKYFMLGIMTLTVGVVAFYYAVYCSLFLLLPIFISTRYYDRKLTLHSAAFVWMVYAADIFLNMYLEVASDNIRRIHEIQSMPIWKYGMDPVYYILLPKTILGLVFLLINFNIAENGRKMLDEQSDIRMRTGRLEAELSTAENIQQVTLSRDFDSVCDADCRLFASMNTAKEVGGDFYDFMKLDDNTLGLVIADVSDKGLEGAMIMMVVKNAFRMALTAEQRLGCAVKMLNQAMLQNNPECEFVTMWIAAIDLRTGVGRYVNAGHVPPMLRHADGTVERIVSEPDPFVGVFDAVEYHEHILCMAPGDTLFLYTDGATDAENEEHRMIGEDGLTDLVSQASGEPEAMCRSIHGKIRAYIGEQPQFDDITMMAFQMSRCNAGTTRSERLAAGTDATEQLITKINRDLDAVRCPAKERSLVDTIVDELSANISEYAYGDGNGIIGCDYAVGENFIFLEFRDSGEEFDPLRNEDPEFSEEPVFGGLGIYLVKNLADELSYRRENGENVLTVRKVWSTQPGAE